MNNRFPTFDGEIRVFIIFDEVSSIQVEENFLPFFFDYDYIFIYLYYVLHIYYIFILYVIYLLYIYYLYYYIFYILYLYYYIIILLSFISKAVKYKFLI